MPVIEKSTYKSPFIFKNSHLQTVIPTLLRKVKGINYSRERIETSDGDFLDIDFSVNGSDRIVILSHGLEGNSERAYMLGMMKAFNKRGWDGVSFNFRGCSGVPNRSSATYHSGRTDDLQCVIDYVIRTGNYKSISLVGFSLGANLTLKYAGERGERISHEIKSAIGISAPCDLLSSSIELHKKKNYLYSKRFLLTLIDKMKEKEGILPPGITRNYSSIKTLKDFDNNFTGPLNGFADAYDYWEKCSSGKYIRNTAIPTLIINAKDDPILGERCYPYEDAMQNDRLFLEVPENGGHVGFITFGNSGEFWHETRATEFAGNHI